MIINAEFDEIDETGDELDLPADDSLPWLEADEERSRGGGIDAAQMAGFVAILLALGVAVVGLVYFMSNYNRGPAPIADASMIEAPEGPYKERPEDAGGKQFPGTGDVAPGVGQGDSPEARLADATGAGSGDGDVNVPMPAIAGGAPSVGSGAAKGAPTSTSTPAPAATPAAVTKPVPAASGAGVGVQLAAYSSRARAEKGWRDLERQSKALEGVAHRVVEGRVDIGTVYRLQAVAANRAEADALCRTLKDQGLDCQVKP